jgi:hypothetical protein
MARQRQAKKLWACPLRQDHARRHAPHSIKAVMVRFQVRDRMTTISAQRHSSWSTSNFWERLELSGMLRDSRKKPVDTSF